MKILPESLEQDGYSVVEELKHDDLINFLRNNVKQRGLFYYVFIVTLLILWTLSAFVITYYIINDKVSALKGILAFFTGFGLVFIFIPFHELLHALAYRIVGAKEVSYYSNFKKFYFAAIAHMFVINLREFMIVALSPFLFVIVASLITAPFVNEFWRIVILGFTLLHTMFCSGDFYLLNYMQCGKKSGLVSYDDKVNKVSYFYRKDK